MAADANTETDDPVDLYLPKRPHLSVREVAVFLGLSQGKIYQMISDRFLPAIRIGGLIKIGRERFLAWYREQSIGQDT